MPRKPISAEVILEGETRVVLTIDDGEIVRTAFAVKGSGFYIKLMQTGVQWSRGAAME